MQIDISIFIDCELSGLDKEEVKNNVYKFVENLLVNGATNEEVGLRILGVKYQQ